MRSAIVDLLGDREAWMGRVEAARRALVAQVSVDGAGIAAIGYCLGGSTVLEFARGGGDIIRVVSFHGGLDLVGAEWDYTKVKARLLVCTGAEDPLVPWTALTTFQNNVRNGGVTWSSISTAALSTPLPGLMLPHGARRTDPATIPRPIAGHGAPCWISSARSSKARARNHRNRGSGNAEKVCRRFGCSLRCHCRASRCAGAESMASAGRGLRRTRVRVLDRNGRCRPFMHVGLFVSAEIASLARQAKGIENRPAAVKPQADRHRQSEKGDLPALQGPKFQRTPRPYVVTSLPSSASRPAANEGVKYQQPTA